MRLRDGDTEIVQIGRISDDLKVHSYRSIPIGPFETETGTETNRTHCYALLHEGYGPAAWRLMHKAMMGEFDSFDSLEAASDRVMEEAKAELAQAQANGRAAR